MTEKLPKPPGRDAKGMEQAREAKLKRQAERRDNVIEALHAAGKRAQATLVEGLDATTRQYDSKRGEIVEVGPDHSERRQNATAILDRIGLGPKAERTAIEVNQSVQFLQVLQELEEEQRPIARSTHPTIVEIEPTV